MSDPIYVCTCSACGITTRVEEGQAWKCCACVAPYVIEPETVETPVPPEEGGDGPA